jgi:hypothetical protein
MKASTTCLGVGWGLAGDWRERSSRPRGPWLSARDPLVTGVATDAVEFAPLDGRQWLSQVGGDQWPLLVHG